MPKFDSPITIAKCTDKSWCNECPHQIDAVGWDGGGSMNVEIPVTDAELDAIIKILQDYRTANPQKCTIAKCTMPDTRTSSPMLDPRLMVGDTKTMELFHRLWTIAVGQDRYDKKEWQKLEADIRELAQRTATPPK